MRLALAAAISLVVAGVAPAQELAVAGRTPKGTVAVFSVPNAGSAWQGLAGSPLGRQMINTMVTDALPSHPGWGVFQADRPGIESDLGFSLEPGRLFGPTVLGFDLYAADPDGKGTAIVLNTRFREISAPGRILDRIKKEAQASGGVGFGRASTTIEESTTSGRRMLLLPAFSLYLAHEGNVLVMSTSNEGLRSALNDEGASYFGAPGFLDPFGAIADEPHNAWIHGKAMEFGKLLGDAGDEIPVDSVLQSEQLAATIDMRSTHLKLTNFIAREGMDPALLRYVANSPPAGQLEILSSIPQDAKLALATNHFNSDLLWDMTSEQANESGMGAAVSALDQQSASMKSMLGFDPRRDFLSQLGPELAVVLNDFSAGDPGTIPIINFTIAAAVRNSDRMQEAMGNLERVLAEGAAGGAAEGTTPAPVFQAESINGIAIRAFKNAAIDSTGYSPAYTITEDGRLIIGTHKESVAKSAAATSSITASKSFSDARALMSANRNFDFFVSTGFIGELLKAAVPQSGLDKGDMQYIPMIINAVQAARSFSMSQTYSTRGQKVEVLLLM